MSADTWRRGPRAAALAALTLLTVWPVLRAGYPSIGDGLNHYYRLVEFAHLLRQGVWFPRWAPDLAYGFGYPLFNYYPPLTYYLGALLHALGLSLADSLLGVYALAWALAVTGAYAAARARWGEAAGLLAGAAYGLSPYLYFDALARGAVPETLALGLLPWVVWAFGRLGLGPARGWGAAAGLFAALLLTHFLTAFVALPLLAVAALWPAAPEAAGWRGRAGRLGLAVALGLGLSAYFLLPAVLETGAVQVHQLTSPGDLDFRNNFLQLGELFAWPRTYDPQLVFHAVPPSLSLAALAVALLGLAWQAARARRVAWETAAWLAVLAGYALLTLPPALPLWANVPGVSVIQFPWRLVGPASLALALLAGRALASRSNPESGVELGPSHSAPPSRNAVLSARCGAGGLGPFVTAIAALYVFALTWSFGPRGDAPAAAGVADLARYEQAGGQLGTTSAGEFLPAAVATLPAPDALSGLYAAGDVIPRLNTVPAGVTVTAQTPGVTRLSATVTADAPVTLTFDLFAFPGWRATVDGRAAPVGAAAGSGLLTVGAPAGTHTLALTFGLTPLRGAAAALSLLTAAGLAAALWRGRRRAAAASEAPRESAPAVLFGATALAALVLLAGRVGLVDGRATVFARTAFDDASVAGVARALDVNFADQLVLIGQDPAALTLPADGALELTLYWRAQTPPRTDYAVTVQVWDTAGHLWAQSDAQHPGRQPTTRWRGDQYARDAHRLTLPLGTPPGTYRLMVGVYAPGAPPLSVLDAERLPRGGYYALGPLTVTRAAAQPQWTQPPVANVGVLRLLELAAEPRAPRPGDDLTLTMLWQAPSPPPNLTLSLGLLDARGNVVAETSGPPSPEYPILDWRRNELVRAVAELRLPADADAAPGPLRLAMVQHTVSTGAPIGLPVELPGYTFTVTALTRSYAEPPVAHRLNAAVGPAATLLGYAVDPAAGTVTLYWQAQARMDTRYTVFAQALGPDGALLAQADQEPLRGARPTTSWLPGEILTDPYTLPLTGAAQLSVGLYDPATGTRLATITIAAADF
ncbi:MAG: hypothetical protein IT317_20460 [Anaerolineales bacterium]|nr:hypothetical protein [Anaerolineales bacterium]